MSIMSLVSLAVSILGSVVYAAMFRNPSLTLIFIILGIVSILLPPIAKKTRLSQGKKGKAFEIIAIIVGGFNFYCIFFALTTLPILFAFLGWVICGIAYKAVK